jgi:hypothetical protein
MRDGRPVTVEVTSDGAGLVSHAGSALVAQVADKVGLTQALSLRVAGLKQRRRGHDPGRVIRDLAVMLADGGECVSDLGAVREQDALFGRARHGPRPAALAQTRSGRPSETPSSQTPLLHKGTALYEGHNRASTSYRPMSCEGSWRPSTARLE